MRFERSTDYARIGATLRHPRIFPFIGDDYAPSVEEFEPVEDPRIVYLAAYEGDAYLGLMVFVPMSRTCFDIHCALLPIARGPRSAVAAAGAIAWVFRTFPECARIVAAVPASNRLAAALARRVGMRAFGVNERSFLKHGVLRDQILLGISRQ